jgi:tryptophan-rich sensory protein
MFINESQQNSSFLPLARLFNSSHRTVAEQLVGLSIYLLVSLAFGVLYAKLVSHQSLIEVPWVIPEKVATPIWVLYFTTLGLSMWTLWRRYSLRLLKVEFAVYLSQLLFQVTWAISFFVLQEGLLALVILLLLWCNNILAALLFWKKERLSGQLLFLPFLWIFYVIGLNMAICISNP